jgi:hypothetical protein
MLGGWFEKLIFINFFGLTLFLSLSSDILYLFTSYLSIFYIISRRLYSILIEFFYSYWRLFMGRKKNILRNRIDTIEYDFKQNILGTLFFTILLFLYPTILVYYISFTLFNLLVFMIQSIIYFFVIFLNTFKIYLIFFNNVVGMNYDILYINNNITILNLKYNFKSFFNIFNSYYLLLFNYFLYFKELFFIILNGDRLFKISSILNYQNKIFN